VDYFLFTSKQGYCDLFATALAVMARAVDIPTRFVTGYVDGDYDPQSQRYVLRQSDAHAWVEAYDPNIGWVTVEATPEVGPVTLSHLDRTLVSLQSYFRMHPLARTGALALVAVALVLAVFITRKLGRYRRELALDRNDPGIVVLRAYARLLRALSRRGYAREASQTPLEYLNALQQPPLAAASRWRRRRSLPAAALSPIRQLTDLFLLARYRGQISTTEEAAQAVTQLELARAALRGKPATAPH
jgi:hypothetical protein